MKTFLRIAFIGVLASNTMACIWDSDTLPQERQKSPEMAKLILGETTNTVDATALRDRIKKLQADPHENDPAWWNDLAGAHLRLGEAKEAAALLEPIINRFPNDYGVHANLGTAYHLLGRYKEAEKEIARDLELNPEAHFGLEKYHLALLQYLMRDKEYQKNHVYVDEYSRAVLKDQWSELSLMSLYTVESDSSEFANRTNNAGDFPAYRLQWDLASETNLEAGLKYMASLNPHEPACFVMLGAACLSGRGGNRDLNLAIAAFQKAIDLHSIQAELLQARISTIRGHISQARAEHRGPIIGFAFLSLIPVVIGAYIVLKIRESRRKANTKA